MKICISGAAGTGKTTLVNALAKKLKYPIVPEFARDYMEGKFSSIMDMSNEDLCRMQEWILKNKIKRELKLKNFVADRSVADNLFYSTRIYLHSEEDCERIYQLCAEHIKIYDRIFILGWNDIKFKSDGYRHPARWFHFLSHCGIVGILEEFEKTYIRISGTTVKDRVKEILNYI